MDKFSKEYTPFLNRWEYDIVWVTDKYDGMMSGYCRYKGKLHYLTCVEETENDRLRMFAVYRLPLHVRILTWYRYHKWYMILDNKLLWKLYLKKYQLMHRLLGYKLRPKVVKYPAVGYLTDSTTYEG